MNSINLLKGIVIKTKTPKEEELSPNSLDDRSLEDRTDFDHSVKQEIVHVTKLNGEEAYLSGKEFNDYFTPENCTAREFEEDTQEPLLGEYNKAEYNKIKI